MKNNYKNILFMNFGGIGDEILFLPTIISIKKAYPEAKITLALEPRSKGIKDLTNIIDELVFCDVKGKSKYTELIKLILIARKRKFDLVISAGGNVFISIILFLTGIKTRVGYNAGVLSRKLLTHAVALNKKQYAVDMYHDLATPLTQIKTNLPEICINRKEKIGNTVLIHPGVSKLSVSLGMIKTIPAEKWANVIDLLIDNGKKVILAGGPDDKECIETIRNTIRCKENTNFTDMFGKTKNLVELAELISSAEKFVCSDSAPLHIAVALKIKTYAIFGPTDDSKLIPKSLDVIALKVTEGCPLKPCLWERRQTTCESLACLNFNTNDIVNSILKQ